MNGQPDSPELEAGDVNPEIEADAEETSPEETDPDAVLADLQAKVDENWDRYLRSAAEVENVRKRAVRDVEHARKFALENIGRALLDVRDSLELGMAATDASDVESILAGSAATLKLLSTTFERFGIVEVDPEGEPFDPELHEAMTVQPSADAEPGSVLTVIQKGYTLNGRLLRPARVIVAAEPADPE